MKNSIVMLLCVALCSCAENSKMETIDSTPGEVAPAIQSQPVNISPAEPNLKLIRTADYRFRVDNLDKRLASIERHVRKFPAHISSSNLSMEGDMFENRMTIRVRSEFFDDLLKEIDKEAVYTHYRNIRTEDVGKQFVDLESRLKTKREVQERYQQILRTKAGKIEELLAAEKQIGELQEEIEATVSRLTYLKDQVAYSTINLEFYERVTPSETIASDEDPAWSKFGVAFMSGLTGAIEVLIKLTSVWPLLVLAGVSFLLLRKRLHSVKS